MEPSILVICCSTLGEVVQNSLLHLKEFPFLRGTHKAAKSAAPPLAPRNSAALSGGSGPWRLKSKSRK